MNESWFIRCISKLGQINCEQIPRGVPSRVTRPDRDGGDGSGLEGDWSCRLSAEAHAPRVNKYTIAWNRSCGAQRAEVAVVQVVHCEATHDVNER